MSSNASYYLVVGEISTFMLNFNDEEGDNIIMNAIQNDLIYSFVQNTDNPYQYRITLQGNEVINNSTYLRILYTDSYHQDSNFIQLLNIEFYWAFNMLKIIYFIFKIGNVIALNYLI